MAGEVCSVWQLTKTRRRMRPWIAMVTAYALALQLLLTGVAAAHMMAPADASADGLFAICHSSGDGLAGDQDGTGKAPQPQAPCALCTLTSTAQAILPTAHVVSIIDAKSLSDVVPWSDARIIAYDSPTGHYQRGPPASDRSSG
jgi:hypothetical protein